MKKTIFIILSSLFLSTNIFAGCMKSEIKELDAKMNSSEISQEKMAEISKLRELVVANEHKNSTLAFESYEKALSLLN